MILAVINNVLGKSRLCFSLFKRHIFAFKLLMDMDDYFLAGQVKGYMTNQKMFINTYTNCQSNLYSPEKNANNNTWGSYIDVGH